MAATLQIPYVPLAIAVLFSAHGFRRGSLSPSGAAIATIVGALMLAVPLRAFGISLLSFYLIGSRATKVGKQLKAQLEDGHQEAGYRSGFQVVCNSFSAFIAAMAWEGLFVPGSLSSLFIHQILGATAGGPAYSSNGWCPLSPNVFHGWSRALVFAALGHFACCLGDTLASELGILSKSPPILITSLKTVPPGTNGGVSRVGTLASLAGGLAMGGTLAGSLLIENGACRGGALGVAQAVAWGGFAGLFGSLVDSFLGATVQQTKYSATSKRILTDESGAPPKDAEIKVVSGLNVLTNNQVNLLSSVITALVLARFA